MAPYKDTKKVYTKKVTVHGKSKWVRAKTKAEVEAKAKAAKKQLQEEYEEMKQLDGRILVEDLAEEWIRYRAVRMEWGAKHEKEVRSNVKNWIVPDPGLGAADLAAYNKEKHIRTSQSKFSENSADYPGFPVKAGKNRRRREIDKVLEAEKAERLRKAEPRPTLKGKFADEVTHDDLEEILEGMKAGGYSYSSVKKTRDNLQLLFKHAVQRRYVAYHKNPAAILDLPAKLPRGKHRAISDVERAATLQVAETHRGGIFVLIMLFAGLRPQEVAALTWDCVDLDQRLIEVKGALHDYDDITDKTKTDSSFRFVPIPNYLYNKLKDAPRSESGYVWTASDGSPATTTNISRMWKSFKLAMHRAVDAEFFKAVVVESPIRQDIKLYDYRHTYASDLQAAGVPINVAKELLGHSEIKTTADVYTHQSLPATASAAAALNNYYDGILTGTEASATEKAAAALETYYDKK